ncbi:CbbQ/NirQ/NorQ/GpvN family protein [Pseudomonadota bacterium]
MLSEVTKLKESDFPDQPYYQAQAGEVELFEHAYNNKLPLLLKGPTGCGKTRFIEHMAARLGRPLYTVACHDDLTAADLVGRHLIGDGETIWNDGPLTRAVREGAICYLDEVVEARKDTTVILHPLTDDRRILPLERTGETLKAPDNFMLVVSYNPGYQHLLKGMKPSTRQRFLSVTFGYPNAELETSIVHKESGLSDLQCKQLVTLAGALRALEGYDLEEGVSTRLLVYCASLIKSGMNKKEACRAAIIEPLSDDVETIAALVEVVDACLGE